MIQIGGTMKHLLIGIFFLGALSSASEIITIDFEPHFTYRDIDFSCDYHPLLKIFNLTAEVEQGRVIRAKIKKSKSMDPSQTIELSNDEIDSLQIIFWGSSRIPMLSSFIASSRMLDLLFMGGEKPTGEGCAPPEKLTEISPANFKFQYRIPSLADGSAPYEILSNTGIFRGTNEKSVPFRIEFSLSQRF
jgi:hypothetical protein